MGVVNITGLVVNITGLNTWFYELNNREYHIWKFKQNRELKSFEKTREFYRKFTTEKKHDLIVEAINEAGLPPAVPDFKSIEKAEKNIIRNCVQAYQNLIAESKNVPSFRFNNKKFPMDDLPEKISE